MSWFVHSFTGIKFHSNDKETNKEIAKIAKAKLDSAKADEIQAEVAGNTASKQLEGYALIKEHKARAYGDD